MSAPTFPPAPGRLSTTTGCPHAAASFGATRRASTSAEPPARYGTTTWIGLEGYWPDATSGSAASTVISSACHTEYALDCPIQASSLVRFHAESHSRIVPH